ncbi:FAD binding domain-containing protein [Streptosporangium subroseum]|uniref:FAD binding domain-containing protein n=1 Tax=Streptosporangium subroseum TaxID=106412 RepID=UPI0030847144|nr:FAD binding domain-containing protein [Streptosporangium subroseum]
MKPAPFAYQAARSVDEAVALLDEHGSAAKVLAGGQSLMIDLHYRRTRPALLVDVNGVEELVGHGVDDGHLVLGALVRHADLERPVAEDPVGALLARIAPYVAHPPIRARGTFAGSLAWAHPAAEWCAVAVALDAEIGLHGPSGRRVVAAAEWFHGPHQTDRTAQELVTEVRLPLLGAGTGIGFAEHRRTHGSFAFAAAVAAVGVAEGRIAWARIAMANAGPVPVRATTAERALAGSSVASCDGAVSEAGAAAAREADPRPEPHGSVEYRRHVLAVLVRRSLRQALGSATAQVARPPGGRG